MSGNAVSPRERLRAIRAKIADFAETVRGLSSGQGLDFLPQKRGKMVLNMDGFAALTRRLIYSAYALLAVMAIWLIFLLLAEVRGSIQRPPSPAAALVVFMAFSVGQSAWRCPRRCHPTPRPERPGGRS